MRLIDFHSHLVPGVDDGAQDTAEAVEALSRLVMAGARGAITTPHLRGSVTTAPAALVARLAELDEGWARLMAASRPELELFRGTEILLDVPEPDLSDARLRIHGGPYVLVEFPHMTVPPGSGRVLRRIRDDGWIPVLAHPERYEGFDAALRLARSWRDAGAYLQVNGPALVGRYGTRARERARSLLKGGLVDCLGSDYHARGETLIPEYRDMLNGAPNQEALTLLCSTNPRRMLEGAALLPVPPLQVGGSWWKRWVG